MQEEYDADERRGSASEGRLAVRCYDGALSPALWRKIRSEMATRTPVRTAMLVDRTVCVSFQCHRIAIASAASEAAAAAAARCEAAAV